ncbi:uncharacterized protein FSUBG_7918 [Fusarium subglutinans]|uniref:Uncharacterized protein n=1 Tax=Gibberella subglutinans TaxID=42677 RepID=A0A8H5PT08_GIBSU|nr:uncharacterized protein FSUBG_7918 [Fusarium subglutinans]KAF5602083.1 hypothetical protein FSUBG_7918 [Fusarium subglutinans]
MPTATTYFGIGLINNGPLTTTYTPPASCITATTDQIFFAHPDSITIGYGAPTCETTSMGKCLPSGSNYDKLSSYLNDHGGEDIIDYYSPDIACPEGWTTAGTLAHGNQTGSVEKRGVFTQTRIAPPGVSFINPIMLVERVWLDALTPSETLAYCCLALQTRAYFQYDELAVVRRFPAVKLVYKESDMKLTGDRDESSDGEKSGDDKNDDAGDEDEDNGASSMLISGGLLSILAVLFSMLIGAGLFIF